MNKILSSASRHIFVIATGFAALLHSTWSLATLFNGHEPDQFTLAWLAWVVPAFALAFAIDAGQIAISIELRNGERTRPKYITFAVLSLATYFLQWLYMVAHIPLIDLGPGVGQEYIVFVGQMRNFAIWLVPALLPVSTLLYTMSYAETRRVPAKVQPVAKIRTVSTPEIVLPALQRVEEDNLLEAGTTIECSECDWVGTGYANELAANRAYNAHYRHRHKVSVE